MGEEEGQEGQGPEEAEEEEGGQEAEEEEEKEKEEGEEKEEEEEEEKEEGREVPGRQAQEGPAQGQGPGCQWEEGGREAEEGWQGHLQAGHALLRPGEGHWHLGQGDPRRRVQGALGVHQEEGKKTREGLSKGRTVSKIEGIFGGGSMFKLPGAVSKHLK